MSKISCDEVLHELEHYIHGELDDARSSRLAEHLGDCVYCLDRADFRRKLKEVVRSKCHAETAPPHLVERIQVTIRTVSKRPSD